MKKIVIEPVSRVEGEGRVLVFVDNDGELVKARFQMMEFRAFEEFVKGRMIWDMPVITSKICGICPIPQHLASVKAAEAALGVEEIPETALLLRKMLLAGGEIQDHALHFLYLAFPDFVFGAETAPEKRSITGLLETHPDLVEKGIFLRKCGVKVAELVSANSIYPVTSIPGGMSRSIRKSDISSLEKMIEEGLVFAEECVILAWEVVNSKVKDKYPRDIGPTKFMSLLSDDGCVDHYDGKVVVLDEKGNQVERFRSEDYPTFIDEDVERDTWGKFPYLRKYGRKDGMYRVGPLARLNAAGSIHGQKSEEWFNKFKGLAGGNAVQDMVYYHFARCIELLSEFELVLELLRNEKIASDEVRVVVNRCEGEGVGIVEAPRGTLIHHYGCNKRGEVVKANFLVPTTHNNEALNQAVTATAKMTIKNGELDEGAKQQIEMAVRAYDPCLSCATHSWGADKRIKIDIIRV